MNGSLHLGHGFTISKIEFLTGFERMRGKRALWPFGFHAVRPRSLSLSQRARRAGHLAGRSGRPTQELDADLSSLALADRHAHQGGVRQAHPRDGDVRRGL